MKTIISLFTGIFLLIFISQANAAYFDFTGPSADNVDTNPATILYLNITETGIIADLDVTIRTVYDNVYYQSNYVDNLSFTLMHEGITVNFYKGIGNTSHSYIDAIFDDQALSPYPTSGTVDGTFWGYRKLAQFNGMDITGEWSLIIFDSYLYGDGTDLASWSISGITIDPVPIPAALWLLGSGLACLIGFRKRFSR